MNIHLRAMRLYREEGARALLSEGASRAVAPLFETRFGDRLAYALTTREIAARTRSDSGLDDALETVLTDHPGYGSYEINAAQLRPELADLARIVQRRAPETVLEIGTADGGTFYLWTRAVDSTEKVVSLDLPAGQFGGGYSRRKQELFRQFAPDVETAFVRADSHETATFERIRDEVLDAGETVDFLFIDGDHSYEGVKQDFETYRQLVSDGGIIALHDVVEHPDDPETVAKRRRESDADDQYLRWGENFPDTNVHRLWAELQAEYETETLRSHPDQTWGGIGVVYLD